MLKPGDQRTQTLDHPRQRLLLFSVGGRRLAAMMDEVVGVTSWTAPVPVASETPFVSGLVRQDQVVLPVFDLAGRLRVSIEGGQPLWLVAKHPLGNLAICIDEAMPVMQMCESTCLRTYPGKDLPAEQSCMVDREEIPILRIAQLLSR